MMSRKRWLLLYAAAILAAVIAGFNDHGLIPGLPSSIIGSILNQLVKTVGLLGVGDMVLYFREREAHDLTRSENERLKQELSETRAAQQRDAEERAAQQQRDAEERAAQQQRDAEERAAQQQRDAEERAAQRQRDAEHRELMQQQAEATRVVIERMLRLEDEMRLLRSENRNGNGSGNPDGNSGDALS